MPPRRQFSTRISAFDSRPRLHAACCCHTYGGLRALLLFVSRRPPARAAAFSTSAPRGPARARRGPLARARGAQGSAHYAVRPCAGGRRRDPPGRGHYRASRPRSIFEGRRVRAQSCRWKIGIDQTIELCMGFRTRPDSSKSVGRKAPNTACQGPHVDLSTQHVPRRTWTCLRSSTR